MKRWFILGGGALLLAAGLLLGRTASPYDLFTGEWYSCDEGNRYVFSQGIIVCEEFGIPLGENQTMSGAYCVSRDSMVLFAQGVEGLETERDVYLVHGPGGDALCEYPDGTGRIFFTRTPPEKDA